MSLSSKEVLKKENILWSTVFGFGRGVVVQALIHPLDVIKIQQQCDLNRTKSYQVAVNLFKQGGMRLFYQGFTPQLLKIAIKSWTWPMITEIPSLLERYRVEKYKQQVFTGLSIAAVDTVFTPLEKEKILAANGTKKFSFRNFCQKGWSGFGTHFTKLAVSWTTFLTTQKYLRDKAVKNQSSTSEPLPLSQLVKIGIQSGLIVSALSAPFDFANTVKQAKNLSFFEIVNRKSFTTVYRGFPINAACIVIHNIASVILIDKLALQRNRVF